MTTNNNFRSFCRLFSEPTCANCASCCENERQEACENWRPCRQATPSTPNVCEGFFASLAEFPLCLPEQCVQCACNPFASRTA